MRVGRPASAFCRTSAILMVIAVTAHGQSSDVVFTGRGVNIGFQQAGNYAIGAGASVSFAKSSSTAGRGVTIGFGVVPPPMGTISVTANLPSATFNITGPTNYSSGGTSFSVNNAPPGAYTITYGVVSGYTAPESETKILFASGTITFVGNYIPLRNPVVLIPGILGTSLFQVRSSLPDNLIWLDVQAACCDLRGSATDDFLRVLALDSIGNSTAGIVTGPILDGTLRSFTLDYYGQLIAALTIAGYGNNLLFAFPYDWRLSNDQNAGRLKTFIENTVIPRSGRTKVDIVTHSMGGLLTRSYLANHDGVARVSRVIYVGTPHRGAPKSFGPLAFNDGLNAFLGIRWVNDRTLADISRTFPSVFQMLSRDPFIQLLQSSQPPRALTLQESYQQPPQGYGFLRSSTWVDAANSFHNGINISLNIPTFQIVGSGVPTISGLTISGDPSVAGQRHWCVVSGNGDGTVPLRSASFAGGSIYYVNGIKHDLLPNSLITRNLILQILKSNLFPFPLPEGVSEQPSSPSGTIEWCSGSPVKVTITDAGQRTTGVGPDGSSLTDIPFSSFMVLEENEGGVLAAGQPYQVNIAATRTGLFSLNFQERDSNASLIRTISFTDVPVGSSSKAVMTLMPQSPNAVLTLDIDGNGTGDIAIGSSQSVTTMATVAILSQIIEGMNIEPGTKRSFLAKVQAARDAIERGQPISAVGQLQALANEFAAQSGKEITPADATGLTQIISRITRSL